MTCTRTIIRLIIVILSKGSDLHVNNKYYQDGNFDQDDNYTKEK